MPDIDRKIRLLMQLRREGITDTAVLRAIETVPRERFVPEALRTQAYDNLPLPIKQGQTISQPYVVAFMTEKLALKERMKVLEIGTGSGYQAAVLAQICRRVYTIERHRGLYLDSRKMFDELGLHSIVTLHGDGMKGWPQQAPFDRIIVTAAAFGQVPDALTEQLAPGGLMLIPVGDSSGQQIVRVTRHEDGTIGKENILPVRFVPLVSGMPSGS
ncbi:MAG: protein-L-isoaspartate(D-aspartate) O-methyltransferase [Minwuia sp.]|uniref:protein-L-isoaspartate(D-aspartate) O-methyltransferase n=1 Tax=Minwuia sp. TaxID=2493630 RepID=UPI003A89FB05